MISNQQFRLKWNNHRNTVLQEFETLLHNNNFVDCTIGADGKYLKAHKIVLSACSPYLQNIFNEHFDKHPVILLKDVSFKELKCMIDYMYCGEVNISECELPSFLRTAQSLKIKGLAEDISDYDSSSDGEPSNSSPSACNSRTAAESEANIDALDCSEPPMKKSASAAPSLISASGNNNSLVSRKRKTPNSVPIAGKPNASSLPVPTSNVAANSCTTPVEVSRTSNLLEHDESETEITSNASASGSGSATERNVVETNTENSNSNRKRSVSPSDARDSKFRDVKEEPVDTDADNEDNSSYEYANNPCDDSDQLNEDSESNCTNSGKKLGDVSVKSVSCQDQDNEANGQSNGVGIPGEPKLGKGCQLKETKTKQYDEERSLYEYKMNGDSSKSKKNIGVNKACKTKDVVKIIRRLKGSAIRKPKPQPFGSSFTRENLPARCNFKKTKPEYSCNECGKSYRWKEGLAMHKRLYCGQEPQFECPHCNKKTFQKINLDTHINASHINSQSKCT